MTPSHVVGQESGARNGSRRSGVDRDERWLGVGHKSSVWTELMAMSSFFMNPSVAYAPFGSAHGSDAASRLPKGGGLGYATPNGGAQYYHQHPQHHVPEHPPPGYAVYGDGLRQFGYPVPPHPHQGPVPTAGGYYGHQRMGVENRSAGMGYHDGSTVVHETVGVGGGVGLEQRGGGGAEQSIVKMTSSAETGGGSTKTGSSPTAVIYPWMKKAHSGSGESTIHSGLLSR